MFDSTRQHEIELLQTAKDHTSELERQKTELDKADAFPESSQTSEVSKLRTQILQYNNELAQTDDRQYELEYKIEGYEGSCILLYVYCL